MAPLTKIIYKPDTQSTDEYTIIVNPEAVCVAPPILSVIHNQSIDDLISTRNGRMEVSSSALDILLETHS